MSQNVLFSDAELIVKAHPSASGQFAVVEHVLHQRVEVRKGTNLRRDVDPLLVGQRLLVFWNEHHACGHDYFSLFFNLNDQTALFQVGNDAAYGGNQTGTLLV